MTHIELERLFDDAVGELTWARTQMLIAEGLEIQPNLTVADQTFLARFPLVSFGSDISLKRQILAVLCLAYTDINPTIGVGTKPSSYDPDCYVSIVIPAKQRKFRRLLGELGTKLPWIETMMHPDGDGDAISVMRRLNFLQIGATVRISYTDLGESRVVT
jgi:hypothetical protein